MYVYVVSLLYFDFCFDSTNDCVQVIAIYSCAKAKKLSMSLLKYDGL